MTTKDFAKRLEELISLFDKTISTSTHPSGFAIPTVDGEMFNESRTASLSFIKNLFGSNHPYYIDFNNRVVHSYPSEASYGRGILKAIKSEIDGGWMITMKGLVSAEIFSDFVEMALHLLSEGYKDAAAVMIGSTLEEHLRQLCLKHTITIEDPKSGKPKKVDLLNSDLANSSIYNKLDQKNVTALLDLRNKAAHGKYGEYSQQQVELMVQSVIEFMTRNSI
jgi:hypothetical protein